MYVESADIFVTPSPTLEQIVSGTLSYAMGAGKAIVSRRTRMRASDSPTAAVSSSRLARPRPRLRGWLNSPATRRFAGSSADWRTPTAGACSGPRPAQPRYATIWA